MGNAFGMGSLPTSVHLSDDGKSLIVVEPGHLNDLIENLITSGVIKITVYTGRDKDVERINGVKFDIIRVFAGDEYRNFEGGALLFRAEGRIR